MDALFLHSIAKIGKIMNSAKGKVSENYILTKN